jgi:hypothetical protein
MKIEEVTEILESIGFELDAEQPHIGGERFLMSKEKLVLIGKRKSDNTKVAIKISSKELGKKDIREERAARDLLQSIAFTDKSLLFPKELYWGERGQYLIWVIEFIEQEEVFVAHSLDEQFFIAIKAFEAQEGFHATTYEHLESVKEIFPVLHAREYFKEFRNFINIIEEKVGAAALSETLSEAEQFLKKNKSAIDEYSNHLVHTDFVPHNFRIRNNQVYLLDCSPEYRTMHFGNKYEGWARFLNYMIIHNPALEKLLNDYIKNNRDEADFLNLHLMRVYKIGFLLKFYADSLDQTQGDLRQLTLERIDFWHQILKYILANQEIPRELIDTYKGKRDQLRSIEEKERQREFAVA